MTVRQTIVILDDEDAILELYLAFLLPEGVSTAAAVRAGGTGVVVESGPWTGVRFVVARSGEELVAAARKTLARGERIAGGFFDLKLRDGISGLETVREIRAIDPCALVTVVTGHRGTSVEEIREIFEPDHGDEWDYLNKPFSRGEIVQKCRQMLSSWSRRRREEEYAAEIKGLNGRLDAWARDLERTVHERTTELALANEQLACRNRRLEDVLDQLSRTQSRLLQHEKMASIFSLATGVAQEVSRPVRFVRESLADLAHCLAQVDELDRRVGDEAAPRPEAVEAVSDLRMRLLKIRAEVGSEAAVDEARDVTAQCLAAMGRIHKTIEALRLFARPRSEHPRACDVADGLRAAAALVPGDLRADGRLDVRLDDVPPVKGHPDELNQVWLALLTNAHQAVEASGRAGNVRVRARAEPDRVVVEILDDGDGMTPEIAARVFEPFFTTRMQGEGTGLGLSIAYGIIERHGGEIEVESEPGAGTCFRVTLPSAFAVADTPIAV